MNETEMLLNRLKTVLGLKTETELANALNEKQTTISSWKIRNSKVAITKITSFCYNNNIDFKKLSSDEFKQPLDTDKYRHTPRNESFIDYKVKSLSEQINGIRKLLVFKNLVSDGEWIDFVLNEVYIGK